MEDSLPPGYRFYPTEEELISFYFHNKLEGTREESLNRIIPALDIYIFNPWDLPQFSGAMCHGDTEQWFFFIPRQEKEARGGRPNRLTSSGYWKATGSPGYVYSSNNRHIGAKRTMVFYKGRAPTGTKTCWKMNEYRAFQMNAPPSTNASPMLRNEFSLCRVYIKCDSGRAFDRRPSSPVVGRDQTETLHDVGVDMTHQNVTELNDKIPASRPESSSSSEQLADQHAHSQIRESRKSNWDISSFDNDPLWDWEHMNLY